MSHQQRQKQKLKKTKLSKELKLKSQLKTRDEREIEIKNIKETLLKYELDGRFPPIQEFFEVAQQYIESGETMHGSIPFPECPPMPYGRNIVYLLPQKKMHRCTCDLIIRGTENLAKRLPRSKLPHVEPPNQTSNTNNNNTTSNNIVPSSQTSDRVDALEEEIVKLKKDLEENKKTMTQEEIEEFAKKHVPSVDELKEAFDKECEKLQKNTEQFDQKTQTRE